MNTTPQPLAIIDSTGAPYEAAPEWLATFATIWRGSGYAGHFIRYGSPDEQPAAQMHRAGLLQIANLTPAGVFYRPSPGVYLGEIEERR